MHENEVIARILIGEASDQGEEGMQAVLNVMNNRVGNIHGFRNKKTIYEVATSKRPNSSLNEFDAYETGNFENAHNDQNYTLALDLVDKLNQGALEDNTNGAMYYYNPKISGKGGGGFFEKNITAGRFENTVNIQDHLFYRDLGPQ